MASRPGFIPIPANSAKPCGLRVPDEARATSLPDRSPTVIFPAQTTRYSGFDSGSAAAPAAGEGAPATHQGGFSVFRLPAGGDLLDGGPDAEVRPAAAQVPAHHFVDVGVRRVRVVVQQGHGLHDLAGLAVTTLSHVVVDPGL